MLFDYSSRWSVFLIAVTITVVIAVLLLAGFGILKRKGKKTASLIVMLCSIYVVVHMIAGFLYPVSAPLYLISDVTGVLLGVILLRRFRFGSEEVIPGYTLRESVATILDSDNFLTALRSTLPKGVDDEEFGLDHIPFMLNSIDERRKRAIKSARFFLIATVSSAMVFSIIVMYFGYILVNESSAGAAKSLSEIKSSLESISTSLNRLVPSYYGTSDFQKNVAPALTRLEQVPSDDKNVTQQKEALAAIAEARITGDFISLENTLSTIKVADGIQTTEFMKALAEAQVALQKFSSELRIVVPELSTRLQDLRTLVPKAEDVLNKPENRVPEILKRFALGLVIATFFLALLRYMGGLYRTRYLQVLAAENDDFAIRRFYVAFKSSTPNDEQRKAVLSGFMSVPLKNDKERPTSAEDGTKEQYEILKDVLAALSKKL
jgi:hypothetical protein